MIDDLRAVDGLLSPDERSLLEVYAARVQTSFGPAANIVNIGVLHGASCGMCRAGAPEANLIGVDTNGWERLHIDNDLLKMELLVGDSTEIHPQFRRPIHMIFVDGDHGYKTVRADIIHWVQQYTVIGGFALFHDAHYEPESQFYNACRGVREALAEILDTNEDWRELQGADTVRVFQRKR